MPAKIFVLKNRRKGVQEVLGGVKGRRRGRLGGSSSRSPTTALTRVARRPWSLVARIAVRVLARRVRSPDITRPSRHAMAQILTSCKESESILAKNRSRLAGKEYPGNNRRIRRDVGQNRGVQLTV